MFNFDPNNMNYLDMPDSSFALSGFGGGLENGGGLMNLGQGNGFMNGLNQFGSWANENSGLLSGGLGALNAVNGIFQGFNQNKLMKDALGFQKQQYIENRDASRKAYNYDLYEQSRQKAAANPNAESADSVMAKWGL